MRSLNTLQKLSKIGRVLSKIAFILAVAGFCGCIAGLLSLSIGNGSLIKFGGVTLHGLIENGHGSGTAGAAAALSGWMFVCAGEAVLAKFAEVYFKNELKAGTPFTHAGARELMRLGILALAVPVGCAVAGSIAEGIVAGVMGAEAAVMDMRFDNEATIAMGVMFILGSLLCRCGAELGESE